jgi:hypothetical protein
MDNEPQVVPANSGISVSAQPALASAPAADNNLSLTGVASPTPATPLQSTTPTGVPQASVDTGKLKALLITLGHDIEAEWDHLIALAKKAL